MTRIKAVIIIQIFLSLLIYAITSFAEERHISFTLHDERNCDKIDAIFVVYKKIQKNELIKDSNLRLIDWKQIKQTHPASVTYDFSDPISDYVVKLDILKPDGYMCGDEYKPAESRQRLTAIYCRQVDSLPERYKKYINQGKTYKQLAKIEPSFLAMSVAAYDKASLLGRSPESIAYAKLEGIEQLYTSEDTNVRLQAANELIQLGEITAKSDNAELKRRYAKLLIDSSKALGGWTKGAKGQNEFVNAVISGGTVGESWNEGVEFIRRELESDPNFKQLIQQTIGEEQTDLLRLEAGNDKLIILPQAVAIEQLTAGAIH